MSQTLVTLTDGLRTGARWPLPGTRACLPSHLHSCASFCVHQAGPRPLASPLPTLPPTRYRGLQLLCPTDHSLHPHPLLPQACLCRCALHLSFDLLGRPGVALRPGWKAATSNSPAAPVFCLEGHAWALSPIFLGHSPWVLSAGSYDSDPLKWPHLLARVCAVLLAEPVVGSGPVLRTQPVCGSMLCTWQSEAARLSSFCNPLIISRQAPVHTEFSRQE